MPRNIEFDPRKFIWLRPAALFTIFGLIAIAVLAALVKWLGGGR
jgi:hypothetical protein